MSASGKNYVVDDFTTVYSTPVFPVGQIVESEGYEYRFILNGDTDTATAGCPVAPENFTDKKWKACYDLSDGLDGAVLGIVMADLATGEYGWVMREGVYETCTVGGAMTVGNNVVAKTTDATFRAATAGDLVYNCGVTLEAATQAATGVAIYIKGI